MRKESTNSKDEIKLTIPKKTFIYVLVLCLCIGSFIGGYYIGTGGITGAAVTQSKEISSCASYVGLDMQQFNKCFNSGKKEQVLANDANLANKYGIMGTPTFVLNCKYKLVGFQDLEDAIVALNKGEDMTEFFEQKKQEALETLNEEFELLSESFHAYVIKELKKTMSESEAEEKYEELIEQVMAQESLEREEAENFIENQIKDSFEQTKTYVDASYADIILPGEGCGTNKVVVQEFAEFKCPYCYQIEPLVSDLMGAYGNIISYEYHHIVIHGEEVKNQAIASECARDQGKFDEFKECIFNINFS